jgi:hypothetical protein
MRHSKPGFLILIAFLVAFVSMFTATACKKDDVKPKETPALPAQPPLEPLEDEFQEPDSTPATTAADPDYGQVPNGPYTLQIQLLQVKSAAVKLAETLKAAGIPAYVTSVVDPKPELPGTFYRVRAGSFATTAAARHYGEINLKPLGRDYWVDLKARDSEPVQEVYKPRAAVPTPATPATPVVQPKIVEPTPAPVPTQPKIVEPVQTPAPVTPPPAPAPAAKPAPTPLDPAIVPKDIKGKPAVTEDTGSVQDW